MKTPELLDLYTDYCLTSFSSITATSLSKLVDQHYSHDQISRFLSQPAFTQKQYWKIIKPIVRAIEHEQGVISIDDTICEKPHSTENELIFTQWNHSNSTYVKGMNILNFAYRTTLADGQQVTLPIAFELIRKTEQYFDKQKGKVKTRSPTTKNEMVRQRLYVLAKQNQITFKYVVWDTWFSSKDNLDFVHNTLDKHFVAALKTNRKVALSEADKKQGKYVDVSSLDFQSFPCQTVWLKGLDFPVLIAKQIFINKDGSKGELYLISNDTTLKADDLFTIYQKRWGVEVMHKSLKQNIGLEKSPTKYEVTQSNHLFACMVAYCKMEVLKLKEHSNHFKLKARMYLKALKAAFNELQEIKQVVLKLEGDRPKLCLV